MKLLRLLAICLVIIQSNSECFAQDSIPWKSSYKLKWQDFRGVPDRGSDRVAITVSNIGYSLSYNSTSFTVRIKCVFDKRKSWTTTLDSLVLIHEQGHFDISEIFARKLRKAFKEYKFNGKTVQADLKEIFTRINSERRLYNEVYDIETNSSQNQTMQHQWNKKIADELLALKAYAE
ncbi:MAG TPA: DUF922 domain-containing protein [Chitinophagaceae bacterium]